MIDWILFFSDIVKGIIIGIPSFLIGSYLFFKYLLPKLSADMGAATVKALQKDPEIKPYIDKAKQIIDRIEPIVEKFKGLDLDKINGDIKPLLEVIRKIDPKTIEELMKSLKELTDTVKGSLTKPKIPEPD